MKLSVPSFFTSFLLILFCIVGCGPTKKELVIELEELTVAQIHEAYKQNEYSSEELVRAYLNRIQAYDSATNAISFINPHALSIAQALDKEYEQTKILRPLHGIPVVIKDNINVKDLPTTAGSLALINYVPDEDAFIIKKLVDAGAIIIAKSNMAEWAFSAMHTESSTVGTTRNPYNLNYVPAGSSGGTAAAVAANFATIGLGTDTGNSIRGPSSHNALVGFRTTLGLISRSAIVPLYLRNDVVGPMCRTVEDATRVLKVMTGYDPVDPVTRYSEGKIPSGYQQFLMKNGLSGARIGVLRELSQDNPDAQVKSLFEKALNDLDSLGAEIIDPVVIPQFSSLRKNQWCADFRKDLETFLATFVKSDSVKSLEDVVRIGTNSEFARQRIQTFIKNSGRYQNPEIDCLGPYTDQRRVAFREAIETMMDSLELDAIVYPTWNNKPAAIDNYREDYKGDNNQIIAPHTGQPAFTVPMGFMEGNLPAGLQFLGRMYDEPTLIKLAYAYEQGTKHRVPPTLKAKK